MTLEMFLYLGRESTEQAEDTASRTRHAGIGCPQAVELPFHLLHDGMESKDTLLEVVEDT